MAFIPSVFSALSAQVSDCQLLIRIYRTAIDPYSVSAVHSVASPTVFTRRASRALAIMPSQVRQCWSCEGSGKHASKVSYAVSKVGRGKDAKELFLCTPCWSTRHCTRHGESASTHLADMPAALRAASVSQYKPTNRVVDCPVPVCTVCRDHLAVTCAACLTVEEQELRAREVFRCSFCVRRDMVVKGKPRTPQQVRKCWSCEGSGIHASKVSPAVKKAVRGKDAKELFLCAECWSTRQCTRHGEPAQTHLGDMPAALRVASVSQYKPTSSVVDCPAPVCTVCHDHLALTCAACFTAAEQQLRVQEVFRCCFCTRWDLAVKGKALFSKRAVVVNGKSRQANSGTQSQYQCGTCGRGFWYTHRLFDSKGGRGSCAACHLGRACPRCDQYCFKQEPAWCGQCQKKVPAVSSLVL